LKAGLLTWLDHLDRVEQLRDEFETKLSVVETTMAA
jgi:hypothetical protein